MSMFATGLLKANFVQIRFFIQWNVCQRKASGNRKLSQIQEKSLKLQTILFPDLNKTPAQAFTPPANEKKMGTIWIFVHYAVYGSGRGRCRDFLVLKWGGELNLQIWDLNRAHETERTVFPILQVFSMCRCKLWYKRQHKGYSTNSAMNTLWRPGRKCGYGLRIADKFCG